MASASWPPPKELARLCPKAPAGAARGFPPPGSAWLGGKRRHSKTAPRHHHSRGYSRNFSHLISFSAPPKLRPAVSNKLKLVHLLAPLPGDFFWRRSPTLEYL